MSIAPVSAHVPLWFPSSPIHALRVKRPVVISLLVLVVAAFGYALHALLALRFAAGDVYPAYSSLRADPLGSRALFESLELLPRLEAQRLLGPLPEGRTGSTLLLLGCDLTTFHDVPESDAVEIETFAHNGGRVVVTFAPERTIPLRASARIAPTNRPPKMRRGAPAPKTPPAPGTAGPVTGEVSLRQRWGFDVEYVALKFDGAGVAKPEVVERAEEAPATLPENLNWHTSAVFRPPASDWKTLYRRGDKPVILERTWGRGSLVLVADSFPFSNEALRSERQTGLIRWVLGEARLVLFDETHLGIEETPGVATLARRYRLHGLAFGLIALAGLFVWRTVPSFLPRAADPNSDGAELAGRESAAGFVNLLRRGLQPAEIFDACAAEWRKTAAAAGLPASRLEAVRARLESEATRPPETRDPVAAYRDIAALLARRPVSRPISPEDRTRT